MRARNKTVDANIAPLTTGLDGVTAYLGVGRTTAQKVADEAGAVLHIGTRKLYNLKKIDAYIDKLTETEQGG